MEQAQILSTINQALESEGIKTAGFQRTFTDYISRNLPAEGTEPDEAYFTKHTDILRSVSGQFSHDVAEQVRLQTEEFKKGYKPEPPKPEPAGEKPGEEGGDLEKRIRTLEEQLRLSERKNRDGGIREKITSSAATLKVSNTALWRDCAAAAEINDTDTLETVTARVRKAYEKKLREYCGDGAVPFGGGSGPSSPAHPVSTEEARKRRDAFKARMKAQGRL